MVGDLPSKSGNDWAAFKAELIALYPGAGATKKYFVSDLEALADAWRGKGLRTHADLGEFNRDFQMIVKWLSDHSKISDEKISAIYQQAFPHDQRMLLRRKLEMAWPLLEEDTKYSIDQLKNAARTVIKSSGGGASSATKEESAPVRVKTETQEWNGFDAMKKSFDSFTQAIMQKVGQGPQDYDRRYPGLNNGNAPPNQYPQYPNRDNGYQNRGYGGAPRSTLCAFCSDDGHYHNNCEKAADYIQRGLC